MCMRSANESVVVYSCVSVICQTPRCVCESIQFAHLRGVLLRNQLTQRGTHKCIHFWCENPLVPYGTIRYAPALLCKQHLMSDELPFSPPSCAFFLGQSFSHFWFLLLRRLVLAFGGIRSHSIFGMCVSICFRHILGFKRRLRRQRPKARGRHAIINVRFDIMCGWHENNWLTLRAVRFCGISCSSFALLRAAIYNMLSARLTKMQALTYIGEHRGKSALQ